MHWYDQTLRKVHILYVSPEWAKEQGAGFSAQAYVEGLKRAEVDSVQLYGKDHHGYCYYRARQGRPYPRDIFGELIPAVREAGMRFIGYFSIGLDAWALGMYPEWAAMDRDGQPFVRRQFFRACLNSGYREFALEQFEDLVSNYELDGAWMDIIPLSYPVPGVFHAVQYPVPCYCPACCRLYRERFGEDISLHPSPEQMRQSYFFMIDGVRSLLAEMKSMLHRHQPDALFTYNFSGAWADPVDSGDLVSIEGHAPLYGRQSLISRWGRTIGKPFEILTPGGMPSGPGPSGYGGWDNYDDKPAEVLAVEAAVAAAHGGSAVFGVAPYTDGSVAPGQWELLGQVFRELKRVEPYCINPESAAEVALLLAARPRTAPESWVEQVAEAEMFHEVLIDRQVQFDVVHDTTDLGSYRLVIVPDQAPLSDAEATALRDYVENGGHLLLSGRTSLRDEHGQPRPDFALAEVMGVHYTTTLQYPISYLTVDPASAIGAGFPKMPMLLAQLGIEVELAGADQLGTLQPPETARTWATTVLWGAPAPDRDRMSPGVTRYQYGHGTCLYIASPLATPGLAGAWAKHLIGNAVVTLLPDPILTADTPPGVEVVLNRQGSRWVLHLVNTRSGDPDRVAIGTDRSAVRDVSVTLDAGRLGTLTSACLAPDTPLPLQTANGRYHLTVPSVAVHGVVVLE
jgi:hypothetical protein